MVQGQGRGHLTRMNAVLRSFNGSAQATSSSMIGERRSVLERTARGRADAKAKAVKFGGKPILTPHQQKEARKRLETGETQRSVARSYNVSQSTISRLPLG